MIRSDGSMVRDIGSVYLHPAEAVEDQAPPAHSFNFSIESQRSVLDISRAILRLKVREDPQFVVLNETLGKIPHQYLSAVQVLEMLK